MYCPFRDVVHYIGQSSVYMTRPMQHLRDSHSKKINDWVDQLKLLGYKPIIKILEECDKDSLDERELYWINKSIKEGQYLFNVSNNNATPILLQPDYHIDTIKRIGSALHSLRKENGYTQDFVCESIEISRPTLISIEKGEGNVSMNVLEKLLGIYGLRVVLEKIRKIN